MRCFQVSCEQLGTIDINIGGERIRRRHYICPEGYRRYPLLSHEKVRKLHTSIPRSSASEIEIAQPVRECREADKTLTALELAKTKLASLWSNSDKAAGGASKDAGAERRSIAGTYSRRYDLEKRLDAALATMTSA